MADPRTEAVARRLTEAADRTTDNLCQPNWRPSRSHVEQLRNLLRREAAALLEAPTFFPVVVDGCGKISVGTVGSGPFAQQKG